MTGTMRSAQRRSAMTSSVVQPRSDSLCAYRKRSSASHRKGPPKSHPPVLDITKAPPFLPLPKPSSLCIVFFPLLLIAETIYRTTLYCALYLSVTRSTIHFLYDIGRTVVERMLTGLCIVHLPPHSPFVHNGGDPHLIHAVHTVYIPQYKPHRRSTVAATRLKQAKQQQQQDDWLLKLLPPSAGPWLSIHSPKPYNKIHGKLLRPPPVTHAAAMARSSPQHSCHLRSTTPRCSATLPLCHTTTTPVHNTRKLCTRSA